MFSRNRQSNLIGKAAFSIHYKPLFIFPGLQFAIQTKITPQDYITPKFGINSSAIGIEDSRVGIRLSPSARPINHFLFMLNDCARNESAFNSFETRMLSYDNPRTLVWNRSLI